EIPGSFRNLKCLQKISVTVLEPPVQRLSTIVRKEMVHLLGRVDLTSTWVSRTQTQGPIIQTLERDRGSTVVLSKQRSMVLHDIRLARFVISEKQQRFRESPAKWITVQKILLFTMLSRVGNH